ncbi:MAG TPA: ParB/RepB/Spo0J family partition protein [Candidatus Marinimicrobia bacterium]|nr:ParB/RepB/Spo0J family partition protein [Candidatus Neomarinimicrobiota bacterium]
MRRSWNVSNKRLGKGLKALIQPYSAEKIPEHHGVDKISIRSIKPNPYQPRQKFDKTSLEELTASIKEKGILTPITVRKVGNQFILIAGERRLRASKKSGLKKIPAYIINVADDAEMVEMALIENIQRENLNPIEEAEAYNYLNNRFKLTQRKIAKSVGKKRVTISNSLRLLTLPREIKESIRNGRLSAGHGRAILMMKTHNSMIGLWKKIIKGKMSVRAAEDWAKERTLKKLELKKKVIRKVSPQIKRLEDELISILGTKVRIIYKKGSGSIEVSYFSDDDLERITEMIRSLE